MNTNNISSFIPHIVVKPMTNNLWEEAAYIPGASTIKGAYDILAATAKTVAAVALLIIGSVIVWTSPIAALIPSNGESQDALSRWVFLGVVLLTHAYFLTLENGEEAGYFGTDNPFAYTPAIDQFGRGLLELIPFVGNLSLGFLDGRIQIHPQDPVLV